MQADTGDVSFHDQTDRREDAYRIIGFVILAQSRRRIIDLLNHATQVLAHLIKAIL